MNKNAKELIILFKQLSLLLNAGISLLESIEILCHYQTKPYSIDILQYLSLELQTGKTLYNCIVKKIKMFDTFTCRLIQIGEQTGKLSEMFCLIAETKEKQYFFIKKIKQTLAYPVFIIVISSIVIFCLLFFIMPKFADLFYQKLHLLPFLTKILFYFSFFLQQHIMLFGLLGLMITSLLFFEKIRQVITSKFYQIPLIKSITYKVEMAHLSRQIGILFRAGIDLLTILQFLSESEKNEQENYTFKLYQNINSGLSLHQAMSKTDYFPITMIQMIKIGEETGKLDLMLEHIAVLFENEVEQRLHLYIGLLEPLIMVTLGVLIGGIVIGMYLPLFKLGNFLT